MDFLDYHWLKALHIISVIAWMAGLLYLPRLFVYHCDTEKGSKSYLRFNLMERRLLRAIMNPAMLATWVFGLLLIDKIGGIEYLKTNSWLELKLGLVILLTAFHMKLAKHRKDFEKEINQKSPKYFRIINEIPTLLMIAIVILVVVKPI